MAERPIAIEKLQTGFLVTEAVETARPCAALTHFEDLVRWLADRFHEPMPVPVGITNQAVDGGKPKVFADLAGIPAGGLTLPTAQALKADFDAARDHRGPEGPADAAAPEAATLDDVRDAVARRMGEARTADPGPAARLDEAAPRLTDNQQKVLDHLQLTALKHGDRFQMAMTTLAEKAGVHAPSMRYLAGELHRKGLIVYEPGERGHDPFFTVPVPDR